MVAVAPLVHFTPKPVTLPAVEAEPKEFEGIALVDAPCGASR